MDKKTAKIAKQFSRGIRKRFKIDRIILFGSRARGEHLLKSDFDFIIVSEDFRGIPFYKRMAEMLNYWHWSEDLEPLCYTPEEFEKKKRETVMIRYAVREGINF